MEFRTRRSLSFEHQDSDSDHSLFSEWIVTNGLGGYATGTIGGVATRRYHGLLIAALPAPLGRTLVLTQLDDLVTSSEEGTVCLAGHETESEVVELKAARFLKEFCLEDGMPVWRYRIGDVLLEKRVLMPHEQNTTHVIYRSLEGGGVLALDLCPSFHFRPHDGPFHSPLPEPFELRVLGERYELHPHGQFPPVRLRIFGPSVSFTYQPITSPQLFHRVEHSRGYPAVGSRWSPGRFHSVLQPGDEVTLVASLEPWEAVEAISPSEAFALERERRQRLIAEADPVAQQGFPAELVLAADQFLVRPVGRTKDEAFVHAAGDDIRTIIAGYYWFTDWGRDSMISLEGLTLCTGRHSEARYILRTFAHYIRDGLIPNYFPEGENEGVYHTADATLWMFHALGRYLDATHDQATLELLYPRLAEVVRAHLRGTRFGIGVDAADGLLRQGAAGYQLTWMDAKVDDWVVTPRRGKAVEINALWYNALRLMVDWAERLGDRAESESYAAEAQRACESFNQRFWYETGGHLYDVIDGEQGDDAACRPNQLLAVALPHPVLDRRRWRAVVETVQRELFTPVGIRSLSPGHPDYKQRYDGDLRARDAAYHQGTVWAWLFGPYVDAWMKVFPDDFDGAAKLFDGFDRHLSEGCIGSISEVFDAQCPFSPRGCPAQAWSVAEVLRCWVKLQHARLAALGDAAPIVVEEQCI